MLILPLFWLAIPLTIACVVYVPYAAIKGRFVHPVRFALFGVVVVWLLSDSWLVSLIAAGVLHSYAIEGGKFWKPPVISTSES